MLHRRAGGVALRALALLVLAGAAGAAAPAPARAPHAMVASPEENATRAGVATFEAGGNAVDAAVAAAFALAVTQPQSTGIGGGAFALVRLADGSAFALDARETAPRAASADMFTAPGVPDDASLFGGLASGTPGFVVGLALAVERWGKLPLARVLEPAIRLAEEGYAIGPYQAGWIERLREPLARRFPETARIQLPPPGVPARGGWRLVQRDLAGTLRRIAREGPRAFTHGEIAEAIAKEVARTGGILDAADLASYAPVVREPVRGTYRGAELIGFPPPSSGGVAIVEILNVLEGFDLAALGPGSSATIHRTAEAMKLAFADRAALLDDPDFAPVPVATLTSKAYAAALRERINPVRLRRWPWTWHRREVALRVDGSALARDDAGTAHLSVLDADGNAVALTSTINGPYGSWVTVPGTGILMNNEMDDFVTDPGAPNLYGLVGSGTANQVAPGKRPLSSMSPTIVVEDGRVAFVAGSNGGPRIITSVLLSLLNALDFGMDVSEAVAAPRFHHQWRPDVLDVEAAIPADVVEALRARGHEVRVVDEISTGVEAVAVEPGTGWRAGACDPRRDGLALGL
jgi:gamma-glutamyltranspeptidase/glutathione hydrolase